MQDQLMKNIPPNAWYMSLKESDWNFARCPSDELQACLHWELHRERAQVEAGGTLPANPLKFLPSDGDLRSFKWMITPDPDNWPKGKCWEKFRQIAQVPKGWIYHPHFPQLSYLEHRDKDSWKPIIKNPEPSM